MKKRLSLLLATVLAMAMIMGMSTMAYATEPVGPSHIDCGNAGHEAIEHFCVTNATPYGSADSGQYVEGYRLYFDAGELQKVYYSQGGEDYSVCNFSGNQLNGIGWYYKDSNDKFTKCPPPVVEAEPSSAAHTHDYHWQTIVEPTKDQDGLESEVCVCGATRNIQRLPAFGYTLQEYATPMVVNAKPGQTVEMDFGELNSFPKSFMEKVAVKTQQNVSFGFRYNWQHVGQEIKIPAGTKVDTNFDWYGPAKMQELYGQN